MPSRRTSFLTKNGRGRFVVADLKAIKDYIAEDNAEAAIKNVDEIYKSFENLQQFHDGSRFIVSVPIMVRLLYNSDSISLSGSSDDSSVVFFEFKKTDKWISYENIHRLLT